MEEANFDWVQIVAERKIKEAIEAGEFDNVPGMGEPLDLSVDPFTPAHERLANKLLRKNNALPEWMQLEKDIRQEKAVLGPTRERGLHAVRVARSEASRERAAMRLRTDYRERVRMLNTMVLKYCFIAPAGVQQPFTPHNVPAEMAALEEAITQAAREGASATAIESGAPQAATASSRRRLQLVRGRR
jgi:hypothetical protein